MRKWSIIIGIILIVGITCTVFTAKALTNADRILYINRMIKIHKYAIDIVDILSVPDTLTLEVIDKDIKIPLPDSLINKRNMAARNRFIKMKAIVDSLAEELNVP